MLTALVLSSSVQGQANIEDLIPMESSLEKILNSAPQCLVGNKIANKLSVPEADEAKALLLLALDNSESRYNDLLLSVQNRLDNKVATKNKSQKVEAIFMVNWFCSNLANITTRHIEIDKEINTNKHAL